MDIYTAYVKKLPDDSGLCINTTTPLSKYNLEIGKHTKDDIVSQIGWFVPSIHDKYLNHSKN